MPEVLDKNLVRLEKMLAIVDQGAVTRADFVSSFEKVVNLVLKIQKQQQEAIDKLEKTYAALLKKLQDDYAMDTSELKGKVDTLFVKEKMDKMMKEHEARMSELTAQMKRVDDRMAKVKDGYTPKKGLDYFDGRPGYNAVIEPKIYEDLAYLMKKDKEVVPQSYLGKVGGVLQVGVRFETPAGTVDGQNRTFTFFKTPKYVVIDGLQYFEDSGYTISGNTLTANVAPTGFIRSAY